MTPCPSGPSGAPAVTPVSPILLEHEGGLAELKPAPPDAALWNPLVGSHEPEAVDIEAKRSLDVGDVEEGHRLLHVLEQLVASVGIAVLP